MKSSNKVLVATAGVFILCLFAVFGYAQQDWSGVDCLGFNFGHHHNRSHCSGQRIVGNGHMVRITKSLADFNQVNIGGWAEVVIKGGSKRQLTMTVDKNILPFLKYGVNNNHLDIGARKGFNLQPMQAMRVTITSPALNLSNISLGGKVIMMAKDIQSDNLVMNLGGQNTVDLSGSIKNAAFNMGGKTALNYGDVHAKNLVINVGGEAAIKLSGDVANLSLKVGGKSSIMAKHLTTQRLSVKGAGESALTLRVAQAIDVQAFGKIDLNYYGNPSTIHKIAIGDVNIHKVAD